MSCSTLVILEMTIHSMMTSRTRWVIVFRTSEECLRCLPLSLLHSPTPERSFTELVTNPEFNAWNFVLALFGETSLELFFRITETLVDSERKILMEEKYPIPETSDIQPEAPV